MNMNVYIAVAIGAGAGLLIGAMARHLIAVFSAHAREREAQRRLLAATEEAERIKKEADVAAKAETFSRREEFENEIREARAETRELERRLAKREDNLDRKAELLEKKEALVESLDRKNAQAQQEVKDKLSEADRMIDEQKATLRKIVGVSAEEAKQMLMERIQRENEVEADLLAKRIVDRAKEGADKEAREIIATVIQRYAADQTSEGVVSSVELPNDDMKGRIIGREGRNIRAFEKATGIDVIVDDTPGVVVVSGFDPVRREVARRSMEKLIQDGRIHPARIEEVVAKTEEEVAKQLEEIGKQTVVEMRLPKVHPQLVTLLGRLHFRTSYGQNVLQHSREVAFLSDMLAAELKVDKQIAKRCGLLHDIGKAVDQEQEGTHPEIGAELVRRCEERPEVVNAVAAHHSDVDKTSIYAVIVQTADAISAARPGARRESLERYIKRLERLESIAGSYVGVEKAFAIQAGRELRVIVNAGKVSDREAAQVCKDIARDIERELNYPGEVRVTVVRETRIVEYAR